MRTPAITCALLCFFLVATPGKEEHLPGETIWETAVEGRVLATAALDREHVYFGTASHSASEPESAIHCVSRADGELRWSHTLPNWMLAAPVVTEDRLFVGCDDTHLYCLDKRTGEELWRFDTAGRVDSTPCVDTPGNCYFGSRDRFFHAVDPQGQELWSRFLTGGIASSPVLHEREGRVYVADLANTMYAFTLTGELVWSYKPRLAGNRGLRLRIYSSPALDDEHFLYLGSGDHHIYAVDRSTGFLFWREDTGAIVDSSPVISADEFLYVANRDGVLFKYDIEPLNGTREVWRNEEIGQVFYGSPAVDAANNIYICGAPPLTGEGQGEPQTLLSYIDRHTGDALWSVLVPGYTDATPLVDEEGNVYLGTAEGRFVKIRGAGAGLADAPWPTFHGTPSGRGLHEETFSQWLSFHGIPPELASTDRDSDGDGFSDYAEFVRGSHPRDANERPAQEPTLGSNDSGTTLTYHLQKGIRAPHLLQTTGVLDEWNPLGSPASARSYLDQGSSWRVEAPVIGALEKAPALAFFRIFWQRPFPARAEETFHGQE